MTTTPQPLPTLVPRSQPPQLREATRLIRLWMDLTVRAARAAAHASADEPAVRRLQEQVEDALLDRRLISRRKLDALFAWEATLLHAPTATPAEACLICRKAQVGLPLDLPLPASIEGGAR